MERLRDGTHYETQEGALYDEWDFRLIPSGVTNDVKTTQTPLEPNESWYFGYGINTKPEKKDYIVICYVPKGLSDMTPSQIEEEEWLATFMGYIEGIKVLNFEPTWYNTKARFKYQIKSYDIPIRELNEDLDTLLKQKSRDRGR